MPRTPLTIPTRWTFGCTALCALAAAILVASARDLPLFLALNAATARYLPIWLPSCLTVLGHGLVAVMLVAPFLHRAPWVLTAALYGALPASAFSRLGKVLAARPRPAAILDPSMIHIQGPVLSGHNSFPSGHSITIFLVVTVIVLGAGRSAPGVAPAAAGRLAPAATLGVLALGLMVAASRVMVGAHWPSDALGGAALGMLAGVLGTWGCARWPLWRWSRGPLLLAIVVLACAAALPWVDTGYPLAQPVQWVTALLGLGCAGAQIVRGLRKTAASSPP